MSLLREHLCWSSQVLVLIFCLLLVQDREAVGATGATIGLNFTGYTQLAGITSPPDTMGAVGPNHIVELLNDTYTVYDKSSGALLQRMSINDFWRAAGQRGPEPIPIYDTYDPRAVYDPTSERWYAISVNGPDSAHTFVNVGVSISSDPTLPSNDLTRGWTGFAIDGDPAEPNTRSADFLGLGYDSNGVYLTSLLINDENQPFRRDRMIISIPKADLLSSTPTVVNRSVFDLSGADLVAQCSGTTIQPTINNGQSDGPASLLYVNSTVGMKRWELSNAGVQSPGQATLSGPAQIAIQPFDRAPNAKQPDGAPRLPSGGRSPAADCPSGGFRDISRFPSALVQQGDSIWGTLAVDVDGRAGVRWYELNAKTGAVQQEGTISDPQLDLIYPSVAANALGDVVIGFTATGENKYPSAYAAVGKTVGNVTAFGDLMELKAGQGAYTVLQGDAPRWGDYSQTVVDPSDPLSFWTFQEFTLAKDKYAVQVTQILLPGAAPRPDTIAVAPAAIYPVFDRVVAGVIDGRGDIAGGDATSILQSFATVGEFDPTSSTTNRLERVIAKFELPDRIDASHLLQHATLRLFLEKKDGIPAGPLSLLHSVMDNRLPPLKSDYEDASYTDTQLNVFQPTDTIGQYYDLDVTDLVRADYAQDGAHALSAFRLQVNASFFEDNVSHRYYLTSTGTGRPELRLSFIPEPSSCLLAMGIVLSVSALDGRRTMRAQFVSRHKSFTKGTDT